MGLRLVVAVSVLVSAVVHLWLWFDGFAEIDVIGPAFMVNAVAGALIAVAVLVWPHWLPVLAAVGFGAATLGAFVASATVGLFGVREQVLGTSQVVAGVAEVVTIVAGTLWLARWWRGRRRAPSRQTART